MPGGRTNRRAFIAALGCALSVFLCLGAAAQDEDSEHSTGHGIWHQGFYSKLKRNDGQGSCCNLLDCRLTQSRRQPLRSRRMGAGPH